MIDAVPPVPIVAPAAIVSPIAAKKRAKSKRRRSSGGVVAGVVVGSWILLEDGRKCLVAAVLPDGRVYCTEVMQ